MKDLIDLNDYSRNQIETIFDRTEELKANPYQNRLSNKTLAMIFAKPSTRTRVSFETGMTQLGGHAQYLGPNDLQLNRGETIADTAHVLSRFVNIIMARLFKHQDALDLARHAKIPVINGLTDFLHPCQALADLYTLKEHKGLDIEIAWVGGRGNVLNSLMQITNKFDIPIRFAGPKEREPEEDMLSRVKNTTIVGSAEEAVKGADAVFTDTWISMGEEKDAAQLFKTLKPYQVNAELMSKAPDAIFMHCLPAHRGQEVTNEVIDSAQSVVFDEAENRLHTQKAVICTLLNV
ncbi:ornithine carbamoyltransferase [archaeon]|nr:ornithine carbamoyltransferase [archaeon]